MVTELVKVCFIFGHHSDRYTAGIIDDVTLFNIALSEDEMETIMNNGVEEVAVVDAIGKLTTTWATIKHRVSQ
jgi:hypothetical protein